MRYLKIVCSLIFIFGSLHAQDSTGAFWFSLSENDPTPVNAIYVGYLESFTLHAWIMADAPNWQNIGGFTFPIVFNEEELQATGMKWDRKNLSPYWFRGTRWPGDSIGQNPGHALWYGVICFPNPSNPQSWYYSDISFPCMRANGTPYHVGAITFVEYLPGVIDTGMYPPLNYATIGDETGSKIIWPEWTPLLINPCKGNLADDFKGSHLKGSTSTVQSSINAAHNFSLHILGPNPFSMNTSIAFAIAKSGNINLTVYDATGRPVKTLVNGIKDIGAHTIKWDGTDNHGNKLPSGTYFVKMKAGGYQTIKNVTILR